MSRIAVSRKGVSTTKKSSRIEELERKVAELVDLVEQRTIYRTARDTAFEVPYVLARTEEKIMELESRLDDVEEKAQSGAIDIEWHSDNVKQLEDELENVKKSLDVLDRKILDATDEMEQVKEDTRTVMGTGKMCSYDGPGECPGWIYISDGIEGTCCCQGGSWDWPGICIK
jgi:tetrahydromethanopterin S-methyltransferase subunit G